MSVIMSIVRIVYHLKLAIFKPIVQYQREGKEKEKATGFVRWGRPPSHLGVPMLTVAPWRSIQ